MWIADRKNKQKFDPLVHVVTVLQRATHKIILATKKFFFNFRRSYSRKEYIRNKDLRFQIILSMMIN